MFAPRPPSTPQETHYLATRVAAAMGPGYFVAVGNHVREIDGGYKIAPTWDVRRKIFGIISTLALQLCGEPVTEVQHLPNHPSTLQLQSLRHYHPRRPLTPDAAALLQSANINHVLDDRC